MKAAIAIIVALAAVVTYTNWREGQRSRARNAAASSSSVRAAISRAEDLLRQARVSGNAGLAFRAEGVIQKALSERPGDYEATRMLSTIYLSQHRFREAIAVAEKNRDRRPYDPVNYGVLGDGHLELGDYDRAFEAFDRMMQLRPSASAYARVAYARELQGDLDGALATMKLAAEATGANDPEGLAWTHAQVGELYFQLGRFEEAKVEYAVASQAFPGHPFAVSGYAKTIAAEGDLAGALTLLQDLARTSPTPDRAARIGQLLERLGRDDEAQKQFALAEAGWRNDTPEPKSLARFLADRGRAADAVEVAERAAEDRHDIFTEDALAWAYFKAGRVAEAKKAMKLALRTGSKDPDIRMHAAEIVRSVPQMASR